MLSEIQRQIFIAAATRHGFPISNVEAETILTVLESDGLTLVIEDDWSIKVHNFDLENQNNADFVSDIREIVEIASEINEEAIIDATDREIYPEILFSLQKDEYILNSLKAKVQNVIPSKKKSYRVGIVITHKVYDTVEATCWSEAESIVRKKWDNGEYSFSDKDLKGIMMTCG